MTLAAFNGHEALVFTDYTDLETGQTLRAEPGGSYDVAPASGRAVPEFPSPWFTPAISAEPAVFASGGVVTGTADFGGEGGLAEGDSAPETSDDETRDEDPETGETQ